MIERSQLNFIKSLIEEQNHFKLAKYLDSIALEFDKNNSWEVDQVSMDLYYKELRRIKKVKYKGKDYFDYSREKSCEEIAKYFNLSKERIRQIYGKAIRRLKGKKFIIDRIL